MNDTIAAISTASGIGAISIIRVSGVDAISIVNKITKTKKLLTALSHTIHYDHIVDEEMVIDEVLISIMKAPKTFTMEDIVEINTHGGISTTNKVLELLLGLGCRLAEPGEFTKRAFLNGRIDLTQAEGVMDLISSKTEKAREQAVFQLDGGVSSLIHKLRERIVSLLANIEVNIDYPEYDDIEVLTNQSILNNLSSLEKDMAHILKNSENGSIIKEGITTCIIGKPNVGKSSLLNSLLNEDRAIVTSVAGTTRDIVEGDIKIGGLLLNVLDTAGIRETDDLVESLGVQKSLDLIDKSDLILFVLSNDSSISLEEFQILDRLKDKNYIVVINKIDLESKLDISRISSSNVVSISTLNRIGIETLKDSIRSLYNLEKIDTKDLNYLTNARSIAFMKDAMNSLSDVRRGIIDNMPIDMIEIDLKLAWQKLGFIIGESYQDELIDQLFSQFCVGK